MTQERYHYALIDIEESVIQYVGVTGVKYVPSDRESAFGEVFESWRDATGLAPQDPYPRYRRRSDPCLRVEGFEEVYSGVKGCWGRGVSVGGKED